ncbi:MAG TPA: OmpA family protein [Rhodopila sp.]|uniref:OmpA family protein n=1 Tax=Rhodopila sp. TaxID=2480087 RepID=UPI002C47C134|nr:OmpA family protein [Rhodopila sp.]HVY14145.1 OmpA family protein [Rhodopila sp.]
MNFRMTLAAATLLALPVAANAQAIDGLYVGGGLGVNFMQSEHATATSPLGSFSKDLGTSAGPGLVVSLGYGFGNGLRAEIEGDYRYNSFSGTGYGGQEQKFGGMVNVLYDFVDMVPYVTPYVGVGVGYMDVQDRNLHATAGGTTITTNTNTKGSFAYQAIIGAAFPVPGVPGLAVTGEYRFLGLAGDRTYGGVANPGAIPVSVKMEDNYNHAVMFGVRYAFGAAPPPAPAPAPAPVPASPVSRSYLVFFDWDKAVLTDRARQIVAEAAQASTKVQTTQIEVNGYTDTSGTPKYNMGLSLRRANVVAAELVKDGVPKNVISIQGFGETHLLVPTGPGVREPQNRRVEIILK